MLPVTSKATAQFQLLFQAKQNQASRWNLLGASTNLFILFVKYEFIKNF